MARTDDAYLGAGIPEADRLEQQQQADPAAEQDQDRPNDAAVHVDEADRPGQAQAVIGELDEDYPLDSP